jgi:tetratricopeptide (TPR) repeat protein
VPFQLVSNVILLASIVGLIVLVLRRLPEATSAEQVQSRLEPEAKLAAKGLPAKAVSRTKVIIRMVWQRMWKFMLEAKGLTHTPSVNYKLKRMWSKNAETQQVESAKTNAVRTEKYYIDLIKRHPKDLQYYADLGNYYLDKRQFADAANVFDYLVKHDPLNSNYFARLGFCKLNQQQYHPAIRAYERAIELDPSHPNRYYNIAIAYRAERQWKQAAQVLKKAIELEPTNRKYADALFEVEAKVSTSVPLENIHRRK